MRMRRPAPRCDRCGEQVYPEELVHFIDGYIVCPDCFLDFAFDYFEPWLLKVSQIQERLGDERGERL